MSPFTPMRSWLRPFAVGLAIALGLAAPAVANSTDVALEEGSGASLSKRVKKQGYKYHMVAENIAAGQSSAKQVAYDWLGSSGHRKNIMNCKLKDTGIAVGYQADDKPIMGNSKPFYYYWVQVFAAP